MYILEIEHTDWPREGVQKASMSRCTKKIYIYIRCMNPAEFRKIFCYDLKTANMQVKK